MIWHYGRRWLLAALLALSSSQLAAQSRNKEPHLAYAFPAGGQLGTECEVVLGGQHIKEAKGVHVAGKGVTAEIVGWYRPLTQGEFNQLRQKLDDAREKLQSEGKKPSPEEVAKAAGITEEQQKEIEIYRQRNRDEKRQPNDQLEEQLTVKLTIADDAEPGKRELRLYAETAISNPLWIHVGKWAETHETEPNDETPDAAAITQFPVVVNGQIMPGEIDTFSFEARQGMKLVIVAGARDVIPYLADAVPGWFQATLRIRDADGREVSFADSFHYSQDPVVYFQVPRDGRYTVSIHDALYRGRDDFVYRLTVGEIPLVTSVFPLGVPWDEDAKVELQGFNLTQTTLQTKKVPFSQLRPLRWYTVAQGDGHTVQVPLRMDGLPEVLDQEPNNAVDQAQQVSTRMIVNGRIDSPGDEDVFFISGRGGVAIEVQARRHGSPLDSMITLTDAKGKEIAFNDDFDDKASGLMTHHADSRLVAALPSAGAYLRLSDAQGKGGSEFVYRLYIRAPEPDFELRVTPANIMARPGAVTPITVHALREDKFAEDIELALIDPPPGFWLAGGVVPGNADSVRLTLVVPATPPPGPVALQMMGMSRRRGSLVSREAIPAESMMQAFAWQHLVPVEYWTIIVSGNPVAKAPFDVVMTSPRVMLAPGQKTLLPVRQTSKNVPLHEIQVTASEPKGITAEMITNGMGDFAIQLTADASFTPGQRGNLLLTANRQSTPAPTAENPKPKPWRTDFGYLPAVPFEVHKSKKSR